MAVVSKETPKTKSPGLDVMMARQTIYNKRMGVFGYELLFRSPTRRAREVDGTMATAHVLSNAILNFGLEHLSSNRMIVLNVTAEFLEALRGLTLPAENIILDLPENLIFDDRMIALLKALRNMGYRHSITGLDDFHKLARVLPLISIFRVNVHQIDEPRLDTLVAALRKYRDLLLQALKIETLEEFRFYRDKGFDYLQGYFLSRPRDYSSKDLPANKLAALNLLAEIYRPDVEFQHIQTLVQQDVALSFKLLKLINSSFFGVWQKVESVQRAVVMLGMKEIRNWISLIALSSTSDAPVAMMEVALLRAKLCEMLAVKARQSPTVYFTVGMFSALDIIMEHPIEVILKKLPLNDEVTAAILHRSGVPGEALACALAVENAEWKNMKFGTLNHRHIVDAFKEAVQWTNGIINNI